MNQANLKHPTRSMPSPSASPEPHEVLKKYFGYDAFRDGQEAVITHLLAGQSAAAVFPTGGGKSLCLSLIHI